MAVEDGWELRSQEYGDDDEDNRDHDALEYDEEADEDNDQDGDLISFEPENAHSGQEQYNSTGQEYF